MDNRQRGPGLGCAHAPVKELGCTGTAHAAQNGTGQAKTLMGGGEPLPLSAWETAAVKDESLQQWQQSNADCATRCNGDSRMPQRRTDGVAPVLGRRPGGFSLHQVPPNEVAYKGVHAHRYRHAC